MKNRIFRIGVILVMILSFTMADFIMIGSNLISYAIGDNATNHKNLEFGAYIKKEEETFLCLQVNVKKEGYFNGEIKIENSNFTLKNSNNSYVNKIENNTIYLNQMSAGTIEVIKVRIEPVQEQNYTIDLLNTVTKIKLSGIYRDSTQKDIEIQAERAVKLEIEENNTTENIQNEIKVITNKIIELKGEEKRIVQLSYQLGLKENNYPIQEIKAQINIPVVGGKSAEVQKVEYLNNMTGIEQQYDGSILTLNLKNEINEAGKVNWKKQGYENIILTCLYDSNLETEDMEILTKEELTLYNNKKLQAKNNLTIGKEEIDNRIEVAAKNAEESIYKGKLQAGIDRNYESATQIKINFAQAIPSIELIEENEQEIASVSYRRTIIKKKQFEQLLGEEGIITIFDTKGETIETITNETVADEDGNIVIDYEREDIEAIKIQITAPIQEGILTCYHSKTIRSVDDREKIKQANELETNIRINDKQIKSNIKLENTEEKATIDINKKSLSTMIGNDVEIRTVFVSNNEKYELYKSPEIEIVLPEEVENITIHNLELLYENELQISSYVAERNKIKIVLEGEQTQYKEAIEGATIVIHANLILSQKATTKEEAINLTYKNKEIHTTSKPIQIIAPTEVIPIYSVQDLGIETIGQEETTQILMPRGAEEKELEAKIEIINNKENAIENIKILGDFPTNHHENNMDIEITKGIDLTGIENAKIYYSENDKATEDLENTENGWSETIKNTNQVSKYLMVLERLEVGESIQNSYTYKVPNNLDYNETAKTSYQVNYTENNDKQTNTAKSTMLEMQTGVGPQIETKLMATVGGREITGTVKNGEVIKYKIEVANTGTEDVSNITIKGQVPEGTTRVIEKPGYEYERVSYYEEVEDKHFQATIENLKVGEVVYYEYEVRVNSQTAEGTTLVNQGEITYLDVTKQTDVIRHITELGTLRVTIKRGSDTNSQFYVGNTLKYFVIIENISANRQDNIKVKTHFSDNVEITQCIIIDQENAQDYLEHKDEINIGALEPGEDVFLCYYVVATDNKEDQFRFYAMASDGEKEYKSNAWQDEIKHLDLTMKMTANPTNTYVKSGDIIEYKITILNQAEDKPANVQIRDEIPTQLTIQKVTRDGQEIQASAGNTVVWSIDMEGNESTTITIEAIINYDEGRTKPEAITNVAYLEKTSGERIATAEIIHIIEANKPDPDNPDPDHPEKPDPDHPDNPNPDKPEDNDIADNDLAEGKKMISGVAWYDENGNGKKDSGEATLSGVKVKLLNAETNHLVKEKNGKILETVTNEDGIYILDKIGNGKYIAIFEYDSTQYDLTKYKVAGLEEVENSNVIVNELLIENEKRKVAATDLLEIKGNHISNINIGLTKKKNFDLKLDKFINRILIQDAKGTTVREYNDATMAKVELDAKNIEGTVITIEYKIKITNQGEVEGYARKIADYVSREFEFKAEFNQQWSQTGDILTSTALANDKILPGESKSISLTLTKKMTENNTGLIANTAEIAEDYNELGIADSNSTPGNRVKEENDFGSAELVLSIRTGGIVYAATGIITVIALTMIVVIILRKRKKVEEK